MAPGVRLAILLAVASPVDGNWWCGVSYVPTWTPGCTADQNGTNTSNASNAEPEEICVGDFCVNTTTATSTTTTSTTVSETTPVPTPAPHARDVTRWYDPGNPYISAQDVEVAGWAKDARRKWCQDGFVGKLTGIDVDDLKSELGGDNVFVEAWKTATSPAGGNSTEPPHIMEVVLEEMQEDWFKRKAAPIVLLVLAVFLWCCLGCTYCCPKCRVTKARERKPVHWENTRVCYGVMLTILAIGIFITVFATNVAWKHVGDGVTNLACSTSVVLDTILDGDGGFIGLMPTLDKLWFIDKQMEAGSPLLVEFDDILEETSGIEDAVRLMADSTQLLSTMLEEPANLRPSSADQPENATLLHECKLCALLAPTVSTANELVTKGIGNALYSARQDVHGILSYSRRQSLQDALRQAFEPMGSVKDQIRETLRPLVEPGGFDAEIKTTIEELIYMPLIGILFWASSLVACGCCSAGCCWLRPEQAASSAIPTPPTPPAVPPSMEGMDAPTSAASGVAPAAASGGGERKMEYSKAPYRLACWSWCCSFGFMFVVFFLCSVMNAAILPAAGLCVMLDEFDSAFLKEVAPSFSQFGQLNMSGDEGEMLGDVADICIAGRVRMRSSNLLDIFFFREYDHATQSRIGPKTKLREKLVEMTRDPVDHAFRDIALVDNTSLATRPEVVSLISLLRDSSVAATILPDQEAMESDPLYEGLSEGDGSLAVAYATGSSCDDATFQGAPIYGIRHFVTKLKAIGAATGIVTHGCIEKVDCTGVADAGQQKACDAGNAFLDLKEKLLGGDPVGEDIFRCDLFEYPVNGTWCDPINMVEGENSTWTDDCLRYSINGYTFTERKERPCGLAEFDLYIRNFSTRLDRAVYRLDDSALHVAEYITIALRKMVDTYMLEPIEAVADGITCEWMPPVYQELIDGLCYQGVAGFSVIANCYMVSGIVAIVLVFLMYPLWRAAYDNTLGEVGPMPEPEARTKENRARRMANAAAKAAARVPGLRRNNSV